ncbi:hypothetical protein [Bacillus siamensis]|nr:hypothetical protein [Bacillus siamensis]
MNHVKTGSPVWLPAVSSSLRKIALCRNKVCVFFGMERHGNVIK